MCRVCFHQLPQSRYNCPSPRTGRAVFWSIYLQSSCHISRFYPGTLLSGRMSQWSPSSCSCGRWAQPETNGQSNVSNVLCTSGLPASHTMGPCKIPFYHNPCKAVSFSHAYKVRFHHTFYISFLISHGYTTIFPATSLAASVFPFIVRTEPLPIALTAITFQFIVCTVRFTVTHSANPYTFPVLALTPYFVL